MANTLHVQHLLELTFNALTVAVGIFVITVGSRVASTLSLLTHRRALWICFGAVVLIVGANVARARRPCNGSSERRTRSSTGPRPRARTGWPPREADED
jgi:hypothetical protein